VNGIKTLARVDDSEQQDALIWHWTMCLARYEVRDIITSVLHTRRRDDKQLLNREESKS